MKKILCLIDTLGVGGGAERQMLGLAIFLKEMGYDVDLVAYHNEVSYVELIRQANLNVEILNVKNSKWAKLCAVRQYIKSSGGYDCVIAYKDGASIISCLLKLLGDKFRLIVSERNTNQGISKRDRLKFFLYRFADYIVPNAHAQEEFIKQNFPQLKNKVVTITNYTDTSHFHPVETVSNDKLNVLTVARVASQKNILNYLEAIYLLKQKGYGDKAHFDWYGKVQQGEEEYAEMCYKKVKELSLDDMIDFHPATQKVAKCYQNCDVFCLPSNYEGFPNVVCEAMSCAKPIACSRVCDNPHIVQEDINALMFNPQDVNSICTVLMRMIDMPQSQRVEWGISSRSIAETLFSKETFVQKYIRLIEC